MPTYYAHFGLATGNNTGVDATNAWKTFADVIAGSNGTVPAAGDTVLCRGEDDLGATTTVNIAGTAADGYIKFIGVDSSWANVGGSTRAVIDGQAGGYSCLTFNGGTLLWFENFEIKRAGSSGTTRHGITAVTNVSTRCVFINLYIHTCFGNGINGNSYINNTLVLKSRFSENAGAGVYRLRGSLFVGCLFDSNTGRGVETIDYEAFYNCISRNNAVGYYGWSASNFINCVADGNTGIGFDRSNFNRHTGALVGVRSTNNGTGVSCRNTGRALLLYYYGDNNTNDTANYYDDVTIAGVSTTTLDGTDTDKGYTDEAGDDFTLRSDATYRRVAVSIP